MVSWRWAWLVFPVGGLQWNWEGKSTYFFAPAFPEGPVPDNVTGVAHEIAELFDDKWLQPGAADDFEGGIAVWSGDDVPGFFREDAVLRAQALGFVGLVCWTTWVPDHFFEINLHPRSDLHIPYVTMRRADMDDFVLPVLRRNTTEHPGNATITLLDDSPNEWMEVFESLAFFVLWQCVLGIGSCCLALLAMHKLFLWWLNYRQTKSFSKIAVICLVVEMLCNIERAGFFALGGLGGTRQVSWKLIRPALSLSFPLTYLTTALTAAYIHEALTSKSPMGTMVERTRKPLLALTIFYFVTDIPLSIISAFRVSADGLLLGDISAILITIGLAFTAGLLLYIVIRLRKYQKQVSVSVRGGGNGARDRLSVLLDRVQGSTYCIAFTILATIGAQTAGYHNPKGFVSINAMIFLGFMTTSLLHIIAYGRTPVGLKKKQEREARRASQVSVVQSSPASSTAEAQTATSKSPRLATKSVGSAPNAPLLDGSKPEDARGRSSTSSMPAGVEMSRLPAVSVAEHMEPIPATPEHSPASAPAHPEHLALSPPSSAAATPTPTPTASSSPATLAPPQDSKHAPPRPLLRESSFAATRREMAAVTASGGAPQLVEERGPWQVIRDSVGRTYYNNLLTRMTTWTDHTEEVPPPYEALYGDGGIPDMPKTIEVVPSSPAPVLLEERGEWMAIQAPTGHVYYHNKLTRMQTWTDPTVEVKRRMLLDERGNWQEILDPSGRVYYNNKITRQQTWTAPREMLEAPDAVTGGSDDDDDDDDDDDEDAEQPKPPKRLPTAQGSAQGSGQGSAQGSAPQPPKRMATVQ